MEIKITLEQEQVFELCLDKKISLLDISPEDRKTFLEEKARDLFLRGIDKGDYFLLEGLFRTTEGVECFLKELKDARDFHNNSPTKQLPEDNFIREFSWTMSRERFKEKKSFFTQFHKVMIANEENKEGAKQFFTLKNLTRVPGFREGEHLFLFYLSLLEDENSVKSFFEAGILPVDLFKEGSKDFIAHHMDEYNFETNKEIISRAEVSRDLIDFLTEKSENRTALGNLVGSLSVKNIDTINYLFIEKLDVRNEAIKPYFFNYLNKCSNIMEDNVTSSENKQKITNSLQSLFTMDTVQLDSKFSTKVAEIVATRCSKDVHYIWLNTSTKKKGVGEYKPPKI